MRYKQEALSQEQHEAVSWSKVEYARHPLRPSPTDFVHGLFTEISEVHGDRTFGDDTAVGCAMARFHGEPVMVIWTRKGGSLKERIKSNFGMPSPEGYRKALRCMKLAEKFRRSVICIIDVIGAYPGASSEERGQGEAIARNILEMSRLKVPTISIITGEGGSGGALALAVADRVLILEKAVYFVAPPEFAASLTWRDPQQKHLAAESLRIFAPDVKSLGCIDEIVPEPFDGAHIDKQASVALLDGALKRNLAELQQLSLDKLLSSRQQKFRNIAQFYTDTSQASCAENG